MNRSVAAGGRTPRHPVPASPPENRAPARSVAHGVGRPILAAWRPIRARDRAPDVPNPDWMRGNNAAPARPSRLLPRGDTVHSGAHRGARAAARLRDRYPNLILVHTPMHASWAPRPPAHSPPSSWARGVAGPEVGQAKGTRLDPSALEILDDPAPRGA
jgi:hypothetical protein